MKYSSIFSPGKKITAAQYITELVCKNKANFLKVNLPTKFWDYPEWAQFYKTQIYMAGRFLKYYCADAVIKVVKEKNIWSLYAKWIVEEFKKADTEIKNMVVEEINHVRIIDSTGIKNKKIDLSKFD